MYITDCEPHESGSILFEVRIQCYKCSSYNCSHYIKEAGEDGTWDAGYIHICPYEIRYRCNDCGHIADRKSD